MNDEDKLWERLDLIENLVLNSCEHYDEELDALTMRVIKLEKDQNETP